MQHTRELANVDSHVWEPIRNGLSSDERGGWSVAFERKFTYNSEEGCKVSEVRVITGDCNKVISDKTVAVSGKEHMLPFGNAVGETKRKCAVLNAGC